MSEPSGSPRASRAVKLVLMGVAGAALLYSCAPGAAGLGGMPYIWFLPNPFFRGPTASPTPGPTPGLTPNGPGAAGTDAAKASPSQAAPSPSQRGGFGANGSSGSTGAS